MTKREYARRLCVAACLLVGALVAMGWTFVATLCKFAFGCYRRKAATILLLCAGVTQAAPREIAWAPPTDATFAHGYRVHWGPAPGEYTQSVDAGIATNVVVDLPTNANVWLALTSYNALGVDGPYSVELVHDALDHIGLPDPPRPRWVEAIVSWLRRVMGIR